MKYVELKQQSIPYCSDGEKTNCRNNLELHKTLPKALNTQQISPLQFVLPFNNKCQYTKKK